MKEKKKKNVGAIVLIVCAVLALALMIGCIFFSDEIFGMFIK